MDYEKKYKNALTIAQSRFKIEKDESVLTCLGMMFPELRESEDERIRRRMVEHFKSKTKETWCSIPVKDILKWLEKQKVLTEHKEGIYYYHRDGTFTFISHPAVENPHNFTVPKPNEKPVDYDHEMWKNCEANFEGGKKEVIDHPEKYGLQKEQNPVEKQDYSGLNDLERAIHRGFLSAGVENVECLAQMNPAEWSDADMKEARNNLISVCRDWERGEQTTLLPIVAVRARYFLEHLTEPKPVEWSEEDEAMLDSVIRIITRFDDLAHEPTFAGPKWTHPYTKELNFLKKLRNRLFEEND